jgi:hypothetical protein
MAGWREKKKEGKENDDLNDRRASRRPLAGRRDRCDDRRPFLTGHSRMDASSRHLAFHGAIVLFFGLLLGAPYARAIKRGDAAHVVNSWRVAHLSLPIGAVLMLAVAALLPGLVASVPVQWVIAVALIVSAYGFCVSTPLAAITGQRGLDASGTGLGKWVYLGNMVGAWASIVAAAALLYATFKAL